MKRLGVIGAAAVLCGSLVSAQGLLDQPRNWDELFTRAFVNTNTLMRPLKQFPRQDIQTLDVTKAAVGRISAVFGESLGLTEEYLYQPVTFWKTCPYKNLAGVEIDSLEYSLRKSGYRMLSKKTTTEDYTAVWRPINKAYPAIAMAITLKCGGEDDKDLAIMTVFQIGEDRHMAYGKFLSDRFLGQASALASESRLQLRTPTEAVRVTSDRLVVVELYNTTAQPLTATLKFTVRNQAGRAINVYTEVSEPVEANSPRQQAFSIRGLGAYDVVVEIASVR